MLVRRRDCVVMQLYFAIGLLHHDPDVNECYVCPMRVGMGKKIIIIVVMVTCSIILEQSFRTVGKVNV